MDTLRAMRLFTAVAHHGNLSAAGRQLGLSPASVSRQITALEDELGARLLNRTSRKITLTESGEIYLRHAEQITHQIDEVSLEVSEREHKPSGTLRVHSRMLVATRYIVPALPRFLEAYPAVTVDLLMSNHTIDLVERNVDVDIRIGKLADSSLIARRLTPSERLVCASPAYLARSAPIQRPTDLAEQNCLTYRLNTGRTIWRFIDQSGVMSEIQVSGNLQTDNGPALHTAALSGLGIVLMPDWSVRDDLKAERLVRLFPEYRVSHIEFENGVFAVYQKSRHLSAKVRVFVDFLAALFKQANAEHGSN